MRIETEHIYKLVKKYGGVLTDDRHFMDDVDKLLETAHNSEYMSALKVIKEWVESKSILPLEAYICERLNQHS
jgi:hypothetical protein